MNHPEGTPEERRDCVRKLMIRGLTAKVMAELLKVSEHTIHADMRAIKERWIEEAAVVSDHALKAHEEIAAITALAKELTCQVDMARDGKEKAALGKAAGQLFYLVGLLKQGEPE